MTDPTPDTSPRIVEVTTRDGLWKPIYEGGGDPAFTRDVPDSLATVTAERDEAREALPAVDKHGAFETGKAIGAAEGRKERDRLRQQLWDAPHQLDCSTATHAGNCNCWKASL